MNMASMGTGHQFVNGSWHTTTIIPYENQSIVANYMKIVMENHSVVNSGNECNFTYDYYINATNKPTMNGTNDWKPGWSNLTITMTLNKTIESLIAAFGAFMLPTDVGMDVFFVPYMQIAYSSVLDNIFKKPSNESSGVTNITYSLEKWRPSNQTQVTATSGSINLTLQYSFNKTTQDYISGNWTQPVTINYYGIETVLYYLTIDSNHLLTLGRAFDIANQTITTSHSEWTNVYESMNPTIQLVYTTLPPISPASAFIVVIIVTLGVITVAVITLAIIAIIKLRHNKHVT